MTNLDQIKISLERKAEAEYSAWEVAEAKGGKGSTKHWRAYDAYTKAIEKVKIAIEFVEQAEMYS